MYVQLTKARNSRYSISGQIVFCLKEEGVPAVWLRQIIAARMPRDHRPT